MAPIVGRAGGRRWSIVQRVDHPEPASANALAVADLEGGAGGLAIVAQGSPTARGFGVAIGDRRDLAQTLEGIRLDLVSVRIEAGGHCADIARWLLEIAPGATGRLTCRWVSTPLASSLRRGACRTWRGPSATSLPTRGWALS